MGIPATVVPPPLRLPTGSIRATLALILCGALWYMALRSLPAPTILLDSVLLVVAFYFGVRSTALPAPAASSPQVEPPKGQQPLHLPRGTVRTVLAAGFLGVIGYVAYRDGRLDQTLYLVFQVIASYAAGYVFSLVLLWRARAGKGLSRPAAVFRNAIAVAAIVITAAMSWVIATERLDLVPVYFHNALAWTVAFYFGSRLGPA